MNDRMYIYKKWYNAIEYTTNPGVKTYSSQGSRGIKVCRRWHDFDYFYEDIIALPRPKGCDQLTRINPAKDYKPGNMKWDTRKGYGNRRTDCLYITYKGKKQSLQMWCEELGLVYERCQRRLKQGWGVKQAFELPKGAKRT